MIQLRVARSVTLAVALLAAGAAVADPTGTDVTSTITNSGGTTGTTGTGTGTTTTSTGPGSCDEAAQSLGACSLSASTTTGAASTGTSGSTSNTSVDSLIQAIASSSNCRICRFVEDLGEQTDNYGATIQANVATAAYSIWRSILLLGIFWTFFLILLSGKVQLLELMMKSGTAIICTYFLAQAKKGASGIFWTDVYVLLRDGTTGFATQMIVSAGSAMPGSTAITPPTTWVNDLTGQTGTLSSPFAQLFGTIENAFFIVILNAWKIATMPPKILGFLPDVVGGLLNLAAAVMMLVPFVFIVAIFGAYIVESMFAFLAVNCVMPLLFVCFWFQSIRSFFWIGMRIMLGAGLTLVFAGIAMGFTLSATAKYSKDLQTIIQNNSVYVVFQTPYWIMLFVGLVSIIIHLKAKTLATNFSGASDGAGPAAAAAALLTAPVVGGAKALLGGVGGYIKRNPKGALATAAGSMLGGPLGGMLGAAGTANLAKGGVRSAKDWVKGYQNRKKASSR